MSEHEVAPESALRAWQQSAVTRDDRYPARTVGAVMSSPLVTIDAAAGLGDARAKMTERRIHHLMVTHHGRVVAILSDRDVTRGLSPWAGGPTGTRRDDATLDVPLYRVASYRMHTVDAHAPIEEAAALLFVHEVSALPVTREDGRIVGVVTARDLLREFLACSIAERPAA